MKAKELIFQSISLSEMFVHKYLEDLDDAAFLIRPVEGMNHIAWQVGHLLTTERAFVEGVKPGSCPPLPEGFEAKHSKEACTRDEPGQFHTRAEYLAAWEAQRAATMAVLEGLSDEDLDAPSPEAFRKFVPTVGLGFNVFGGLHALMHAGQFVGVRRKLQKPIAI